MGHFSAKFAKIAAVILLLFTFALILFQLNAIILPAMPEPSDSFDCDDGTLLMYRHFKSLGIETTPIVGNLKMSGEKYMECNHVWLLVKSGNINVAYDWGTPRFDRQHYEGYTISLDYLLHAVDQDRQGHDELASTED
jgi:hypothetical protein